MQRRVKATYFLFPPQVEGFEYGAATVRVDLGFIDFPDVEYAQLIHTDSAWDELPPDVERRVLAAWQVVAEEAIRLTAALTPAFKGWEMGPIHFEANCIMQVRLLRGYSHSGSGARL